MVNLVSKGRPRMNQKAFDKILAAKKGEVIITNKEWKLATPPGAHLLRKYLKTEYIVRTVAGKKSWLIKKA